MTTDNARPTPPVTSASIIVLTLARKVENELSAALAPLDLTIARLGLLGHISSLPGVSFSELARMSGTSVQSVHNGVKALVSAELVQDLTARAGSASTIELTAKGKRLLAEARTAVSTVDSQLFGPESDPILRQVGAAILAVFAEM
ncbi:MarR family winged helix-turn-helix transcriptional regulator [Nocardia sp. NPDC051832]|uniref:MarR family winged helix-turn-helix transcriptional regulator n=1 Tax=Nocardia sp. NPDC051832 TaxID=3155673 RepID=UPI0034488BF0